MIRRLFHAIRRRLRTGVALRCARSATYRRLEGPAIRRVLVVCYGNIYRSPFVGEYLRRHLPPAIEIKTAGFHPVAGRSSPPQHVLQCQRRGISLVEHRSAVVGPADLAWADAIVLMDRHNWDALDALGVTHENLIWMGALLDEGTEIVDPYGTDEKEAQQILTQLEEAAARLAKHLLAQRAVGTQ